jgi:hypothetical protein
LFDAVERGREVEVLLNRSLDDLRKLRILKSDPPSIQRWRLSGRLPCLNGGGVVEGLNVGYWLPVSRANGATG